MTERKGLNTPQISRDTPLDRCFGKLSKFIELNEESTDDALTQLTNKLGEQQGKGRLELQEQLLSQCFSFIHEIQTISNSTKQKEELISISLHDMKYFNELINLIICQLIYPLLPPGIGIPLEQRRLSSFNQKSNRLPKLLRSQRVRPDKNSLSLLKMVIIAFRKVFNEGGDIRDLLIKSSGLTDILTALTALIHDFDPTLINEFNFFESQSDTYNLFGVYTVLLQTASLKYKPFISSRLTNITINRDNGVVSLVDFIVGIRDNEEINIEKFSHVNKVLMSKPKSIPSVEYFTKIFDQVYNSLVYINRPVLLSVIVNFVRHVYELNKRIVHDFLFVRIWSVLDPKVGTDDIVVSEKALNDAVNVLVSLSKETSAEFLNELFSKIVLNLWSYYFYLKKTESDYSSILSNILVSFFTVTSNNEYLENIVLNLVNSHGDGWEFQTTIENKLTSIRISKEIERPTNEELFEDIELGIELITELLKDLDHDVVRKQFLITLNRWILKQHNDQILEDVNPFMMLLDLKLLERMNESFKDILLEKPEEVLQVIKNLLTVKFSDDPVDPISVDSDDEDEELTPDKGNLNILLELLSAIISETDPSELVRHTDTLLEISKVLSNNESNIQAQSLSKRINDIIDYGNSAPPQGSKEQDKETLEKAITNMNDPLIPIRAHGLYLLRQLIKKKSSALTLDFVIELHIVQLHDSEPFIYMNVIKSLNELLEFDQEGTLEFLVNFYTNKKEQNIDDRLKIGEVLLNFIMKKNELLISSQSTDIIDNLIRRTLARIQDFEEDDRIRMSSMSLIGQSLRTNAIGIQNFINDSLDCAMGILELEKEVTMKRSAVVLINDLMSFGGLDMIPKGYGSKIKTVLGFVKANSDDYLLVDQINVVQDNIDHLIKSKFSPNDIPQRFENLRISH